MSVASWLHDRGDLRTDMGLFVTNSLIGGAAAGALLAAVAVLAGWLAASVVMAAGLWLLQPWLLPLPPVLGLTLLITAGGLGFLLLAQLIGALDLAEVKSLIARRRP